MKFLTFLILLFVVVFENPLSAQAKKLKEIGEIYLSGFEYEKALDAFKKAQAADPKDLDTKLKIGFCFNKIDSLERAVTYFKYVLKEKEAPDVTYLYMAQSYHFSEKWVIAAQYYKLYLSTLKKKTPERDLIKKLVYQCQAGRKMPKNKDKNLIVTNLGASINTKYNETKPIKTTESNVLYFCSDNSSVEGGRRNELGAPDAKGRYRSDVFNTQFMAGSWRSAYKLQGAINSPIEDGSINLLKDTIICYKRAGGNKAADWLSSTLVGDTLTKQSTSLSSKFPMLHKGAKDVFTFGDSLILFSSNLEKGYGGFDLFFSALLPNGTWSAVTNLGPSINTESDEISPFLTNDGRTLYFSSNNELSCGGFDVFFSNFNTTEKAWGLPENLGLLLNSPADDVDFTLGANGKNAYWASNRSGGFGALDLYSCLFVKPIWQQYNIERRGHFGQQLVANYFQISPTVNSTATSQPAVTPTPTEPILEVTGNSKNITVSNVVNTNLIHVEVDLPSSQYPLEPIFFDDNSNFLPRSYKTLNTLEKYISENKITNIVMLTFSEPVYATQFFAVNNGFTNAQKLKKQLLNLGISSDSITIRSFGQSYNWLTTKNEELSNARIEIQFKSSKTVYPEVNNQDKNIADFGNQQQVLFYSIQTKASQVLTQNEINQANANVPTWVELILNKVPVYRFMHGMFFDIENANLALKDIQKKNPSAFITPYYQNQRINKAKAEKLMSQVPALKAFVEQQTPSE